MNIQKINLTFTLTSPLSHFSDEPAGTMQTLRRQKFKVGDKYENIPVFSGNALRGIMRTLVMRDYLERIGVTINTVSQNLFYTFFNGGSLKSGGAENLTFKTELKKNCPPLVLFGSAYRSIMTEGKLKCGILKPICKELNDYNVNQSRTSIYDGMLSEVFYTKKDRLKTEAENVKDIDDKDKEIMQMKYESETFSAGTELESEIQVEFANEVEYSCACHMLKLLKEAGHLGGKSSVGHGSFKLNTSVDVDAEAELYKKYIDDNKDEMLKWLAEMELSLNA